jgi:2-oxoisovalerate dehydrogenase E1 component
MERDPAVMVLGEDVGKEGGVFRVTDGLQERFGKDRVVDTPLAESGIVGVALGLAVNGMKPVAEIQFDGFMPPAWDQIISHISRIRTRSRGRYTAPLVIRAPYGGGIHAPEHHSEATEAVFVHTPGVKVVYPATPYDAKGLMNSALTGTDPVVFFESQRIYDEPEQFVKGGVPAEYYEVPIGEPDIKKAGKDLTILTIGATLYRALDAAKQLEEKWGLSCEVIDARSIVPFNYAKVIESIKKTRKIVLASDACERGSALQTMAAKITQFAFDELDAPPVVVGARNWITPADEVEDAFFPFAVDIIDSVHEHILPLKGYTVTRDCSNADLLRRSAEGI